MANVETNGTITLTREDEVEAIRVALVAAVPDAPLDHQAVAIRVVAELDRIAMEAHDMELSQAASARVASGCGPRR